MFKEIPHLKRKPGSLPEMDEHKAFFFLRCRFKVNIVSCATIFEILDRDGQQPLQIPDQISKLFNYPIKTILQYNFAVSSDQNHCHIVNNANEKTNWLKYKYVPWKIDLGAVNYST